MLRMGRAIVIQRPIEPPRARVLSRRRPAAPPPAPALARTEDTAWIRFVVVHHKTGEPCRGIRLGVRTPNSLEIYVVTDAAGRASVSDIKPGACSVWCPLSDARLERTVAYVGMGRPAASEAAARQGFRGDRGTQAGWVAHVDEHRVQTGETLASVAALHDMSWKELAEFNWGSSAPREVNGFLRDRVGCWKKSPDGLNYQFTSVDEPGLIYIPRPWSQSGLATEQEHVIRVRVAAGFRLLLENQDGLRIPEAAYEATLADGTARTGRLGRGGVALIKDPPPGAVEVVYPDLDDIEAKSLAACARKAMDDRDLTEVFRVLKHSRELIHDVVAMYERYYNDYTGGGLLADIDQEATDADERDAIEALLRIAALRSEPERSGPAAVPGAPAEAI